MAAPTPAGHASSSDVNSANYLLGASHQDRVIDLGHASSRISSKFTFFHGPKMTGDSGFNGWRHAECHLLAPKVVIHHVSVTAAE